MLLGTMVSGGAELKTISIIIVKAAIQKTISGQSSQRSTLSHVLWNEATAADYNTSKGMGLST